MKTQIFNTLLETVSQVCEVSAEDILSIKKAEEVVDARTILVYFCKDYGLHTAEIAKFLNRKKQDTICEYMGKYPILRKQSANFRMDVNRITSILEDILPKPTT
jgi:chromosomal replication initiation ATPase DnaA